MDSIDFYVSDAFGEGLYDSCKEVKFGTMNTRAIEFIGAGATNFRGEFKFCACMKILYCHNSLPNILWFLLAEHLRFRYPCLI